VPTRGGDRWAGHQQLRALRGVGGQFLAQPQGDKAAVAQVAESGDPGGQRRPRAGAAVLQQRVIAPAGEVADGVVAGVQHQVGVAVDQPRQQRRLTKLDQLGPLRGVSPGDVDVDDAPLIEQHQGADAQLISYPVEQPCRTDRQHPGHLPRAAIAAIAWLRQLGILAQRHLW
jgi:hypothetical protein